MSQPKLNTTKPPNAENLATIVASGEIPVPFDWPADRLSQLLDKVHEIRRRRLVKQIARAIASDISRDQRREES